MHYDVFQIDTFTDQVFKGNSAAVCPLKTWLPDEVMQSIAMENALAETAFFVPVEDGYYIRWFTPEIEMDLCGHATLASAHVIWHHLQVEQASLTFQSQSGPLKVSRQGDLIQMALPLRDPEPAPLPEVIQRALPKQPLAVFKARDYVLVYASESDVKAGAPDRRVLDDINLDPGGVVLTAPGEEVDFVSRYFVPQASIFEDPVTGSAHCSLVPYWSKQLKRSTLVARQLSEREGTLYCQLRDQEVWVAGKAITYMTGHIKLPE